MKIVCEREYRCRVCINPDVHLYPGVARQRQADKNQQDDEADYSVENSLHDRIAINRGAGLFHSTMPG